jgi:hypothetical protein
MEWRICLSQPDAGVMQDGDFYIAGGLGSKVRLIFS